MAVHSPKRKEDAAETEEDDEEEKERAGSEREHKGLRQEKKKEQEAGKKQEKRVAVIVVEVVRQQKMQSNYPIEKRQKKKYRARDQQKLLNWKRQEQVQLQHTDALNQQHGVQRKREKQKKKGVKGLLRGGNGRRKRSMRIRIRKTRGKPCRTTSTKN